jgi:hypothetical protein
MLKVQRVENLQFPREKDSHLLPRDVTSKDLGLEPVGSDQDTVACYEDVREEGTIL